MTEEESLQADEDEDERFSSSIPPTLHPPTSLSALLPLLPPALHLSVWVSFKVDAVTAEEKTGSFVFQTTKQRLKVLIISVT